EARNDKQDEFEVEGMQTAMKQTAAEPLSDMLEALVSAAVEFSGTPTFEDDVCLLAVGFVGQDEGKTGD
ncbi:MAG TPA: hypothetical protein P5169_04665, partial [Kiritimatiellia bacterium]|nr:hypothetical protein [Kiritimatiellia bacterium]